ncbi:karyopherin [Coemansia brasiliensis]|uniref:Karyopherin n=1 Tax=Coemansia brasiliensis TaxID=2650707 RepID=A0A9W8II94_9FUNG|nr:karyopherin [Coemansia brasiliensis]
MDNSLVQRAVQALELVYAPDTSVEDRKAAETVCQQLKDDVQAPTYGIYLATNSNGFAPQVRHFGLQLLEHAIKRRFSASKSRGKMTIEELCQLRAQVWELIFASCAADGTREPQYIREKLVTIMTMIIIRLWPSMQWTDLSAQLMHLYLHSIAHREIALRIWQTLGEEMLVYDRDAMATVRKHELTNGLVGALLPKSVVMELYPNGYRLTTDSGSSVEGNGAKDSKRATLILLEPGNEEGWVMRWAQHAIEATQQSGELSDQQELLLTSLIDTIATFLDWMPIKAIIATNLVVQLSQLLNGVRSDLVRQRAAAALEIISRRNSLAGDERDAILQQFIEIHNGEALVAVAHAYATTLPAQVDEQWSDTTDALTFARSLAQICANLASLHWARKKLERNMLHNPEQYIELLIMLSRDRRYSVSAPVLTSWTAIVRHNVLSRTPQVTKAFSTLTEHTTEAIFHVCRIAQVLAGNLSSSQLNDIADEADIEQFDSLSEFRLFLTGEVRSRLLNIIRGMCSIDPAGFISWIMPSLLPVFASHNAENLSVIEPAFMLIDAILSTMDDVEQRALADGDEQLANQIQAARASCYELGHCVVGFETGNAQIMARQLQTLPSFSFLLRPAAIESETARSLLLAILQKCAAFLKHPLGTPNIRELRVVARRSTAALVRLAITIPDSLMFVYDDLSQLVQANIADPQVTNIVKSYLSEFQLALIAGSSRSISERKHLAQPVVQPIIDALREFMPALQSPAEFISFLGLPALDKAYAQGDISESVQRDLQRARDNRTQLWQVLSTLFICLNRTLGTRGSTHNLTPLWSDYMSDLVPPVLLLIRSLHALWNPEHYRHLPWQSQQARANLFGLLDMAAAERQSIVGGIADVDADFAAVPRNAPNAEQLAAELRAFQHSLSTLREIAYKCMGKFSSIPDLFTTSKVPDLAGNFAGCLFADAETIAARHWRILLTDIAIPLLQNIGNWPGIDAHSQLNECRAAIARFVSSWLNPLFSFCTEKLGQEWRELLARGAGLALDEQPSLELSVSDDMIHEKMIRDWTRAWSQLIFELLASVMRWFPQAAQIENELSSAARVTTAIVESKVGNPALGAFILDSANAFSSTLSAALTTLQFKDSMSVHRVLLQLTELAPSLAIISLMPMYVPPTPTHASICSAYTSRIQSSLTAMASDTCSSVFEWLATDLVLAIVHVLRDPLLIDQQDTALALLADLLYFGSAISSGRLPQHWAFRNSSGDIDQRVAVNNSDAKIAPVGDPGQVFRHAVLQTMLPSIQEAQVSEEDAEHAVQQLADATNGKHRRALLKVGLQPLLAVENSQLFSESNSSAKQVQQKVADPALNRKAPSSWTNKHTGHSSVLDNDAQFDLGEIMP